MSEQVPLVDYLVLGDDPHLVAQECTACGARFFDRRNACASCFGTAFAPVTVATEGEVRAYTIVSLAAPGIPVPFVAAVVDCDGTSVRGNVVNVPARPRARDVGDEGPAHDRAGGHRLGGDRGDRVRVRATGGE